MRLASLNHGRTPEQAGQQKQTDPVEDGSRSGYWNIGQRSSSRSWPPRYAATTAK